MDIKKLSESIESITKQIEALKEKGIDPKEFEKMLTDLKQLKDTLEYLIDTNRK